MMITSFHKKADYGEIVILYDGIFLSFMVLLGIIIIPGAILKVKWLLRIKEVII